MFRQWGTQYLVVLALLGGPFVIESSSASAPVNNRMFDTLGTALAAILKGSSAYLAGRVEDKDFLQIDDLVVDSSVGTLALNGSHLFSVDGLTNFTNGGDRARGYYKSGAPVEIPLKNLFRVNGIGFKDTTTCLAGEDRDSITQPPRAFTYCAGRKEYVAHSPSDPFTSGRLILPEGDTTWLAGLSDFKAALWAGGKTYSGFTGFSAADVHWLSRYRGDIFVAGSTRFDYQDFGIVGGWYWHRGQVNPIKYREDGDDADPNDYLKVRQFIVSGDSLLAVGDPPFISAPSYLWINGKAEQWQDTLVEGEKLLGVQKYAGEIFLLGYHVREGKKILCLWSQGKRVDMREPASYLDTWSFLVGNRLGTNSVSRPSGPKRVQRKKVRTGSSRSMKTYPVPRLPESAVTTVDGKILSVPNPSPR